MKITVISLFDPGDIRQWSGILYHITKELERQGHELSYISHLKRRLPLHIKAFYWFYSRVLKRPLNFEREPMALSATGRTISKELKKSAPDAILSIGVSYIATNIQTRVPVVIWSDATFKGLSSYPEFHYLSARALRNGHRSEKKALDRASLIAMSSDWAAQSAINDYQADARKVKVIPFGANIESSKNREQIEAIVKQRLNNACRLLFLGVQWQRKGGDKALAILEELNRRGFKAELYIVGCTVPAGTTLPANAVNTGFINKNTPEGLQQIGELLESSHFLLLPTLADCTPIVFCEANAFGLPVLTHDVGGIASVIENDVNGHCFGLQDPVSAWADYIMEHLEPAAYNRLCLSSFGRYASTLNWPVNVKKLIAELKPLVQ